MSSIETSGNQLEQGSESTAEVITLSTRFRVACSNSTSQCVIEHCPVYSGSLSGPHFDCPERSLIHLVE